MCGEIAPGKRGWWHPACVEMWHYIAFPQNAISLLVKAHGRICWECRKRGEGLIYPLELEHVKPLWSLSATERLEHKWWLPFNLQLLCRDCHALKTAREAKERAAIAKTARMEASGQVALL
jgi:5-methylcytosine-specific restriction endonuclease McrA